MTKVDVTEVFRAHGDFVWWALARYGVPESDRLDQAQEVYIVVHRRGGSFRGDSSIKSWLVGIVRRVASAYRRRAYRVRELPVADPARDSASSSTPEAAVVLRDATRMLNRILELMTLDQRAVFVMYEMDEMSGREIAELLGCPEQTVYSRLRRARAVFERERQGVVEAKGQVA